jgi:exodeoxyribonuclease-3
MRIATWNINGVRARIDTLVAWLNEARPDAVVLQEIKTVDEGFPAEPLRALGYHVETHGQKGFNGVALLSLLPVAEVTRGLPGDPDDVQARYIEAVLTGPLGAVRVGGLYLPNGNPIGTEKFAYKLAWMARLEAHARARLAEERPFLLAGDFNIIPTPHDARNPAAWTNDALFQPESRAAFRRLEALGLSDAIRAVTDEPAYTFWDYQAGSWPRDDGIRIDHVLLSPEATDRLVAAGIDKHVRGWEKPSDHVPVWVDINL